MKVFVVLAAIFAVVHFVNSEVEVPEQKDIPRSFSHGKDEDLTPVKNFNSWLYPNSIKDKDITFYVYTQANINRGRDIKASQVNDLLRLTAFNTTKDTLVIIHGWTHDYTSPPNALIRPAALRNRDINVIAVDWSPISVKLYSVAQQAVESIGNFVGDFLIDLVDVHGYDMNRITVVGHSLGAHLAGCLGARTRGKINTIVGLDPAGNYPYVASNIHNRLDPTDAQFVQVIVSSSVAPSFHMGHTNFFPNGGRVQPGCGFDPLIICSHTRAVEYYAESLTTNRFRGRRCTTWNNYQMGMCMANGESFMGGLPVQKATGGAYFLSTNSQALFSRG